MNEKKAKPWLSSLIRETDPDWFWFFQRSMREICGWNALLLHALWPSQSFAMVGKQQTTFAGRWILCFPRNGTFAKRKHFARRSWQRRVWRRQARNRKASSCSFGLQRRGLMKGDMVFVCIICFFQSYLPTKEEKRKSPFNKHNRASSMYDDLRSELEKAKMKWSSSLFYCYLFGAENIYWQLIVTRNRVQNDLRSHFRFFIWWDWPICWRAFWRVWWPPAWTDADSSTSTLAPYSKLSAQWTSPRKKKKETITFFAITRKTRYLADFVRRFGPSERRWQLLVHQKELQTQKNREIWNQSKTRAKQTKNFVFSSQNQQ